MLSSYRLPVRLLRGHRYRHPFRLEDEFRIAECTHFRNIQALKLGLRGHAISHDRFDGQSEYEAEREHETDQRRNADELRDQLSGIAIEQSGHRSVHAIPRTRVVAPAVGEEADRNDAPQSVGTVDRDRAD